jgi:hypothetical protein
MMFPIYAVDQVLAISAKALPLGERARLLPMDFRKTCSSTHRGKLHFATNAKHAYWFCLDGQNQAERMFFGVGISLNWERPSDLITVRAMREMCIALQARCIGFDA